MQALLSLLEGRIRATQIAAFARQNLVSAVHFSNHFSALRLQQLLEQVSDWLSVQEVTRATNVGDICHSKLVRLCTLQ